MFTWYLEPKNSPRNKLDRSTYGDVFLLRRLLHLRLPPTTDGEALPWQLRHVASPGHRYPPGGVALEVHQAYLLAAVGVPGSR